MIIFIQKFVLIISLQRCLGKMTYFNLETTYGPYCNPKNIYTPDAGLVRYAGTPWTGSCELTLSSSSLNKWSNFSKIVNRTVSTRFYIYLIRAPTCYTENVTIRSEFDEMVTINCQTSDGSEFFLDGERISITYYRTEKFPLSNFSMIVTPLKFKTRIFTSCGFDCFTDLYCIDKSLVCDRYRNCPNHIDEAQCDYQNQRKPLSLRSKIILMIVLSMLISFDVVSILVCYFCCGISNQNRFELIQKKRKSNIAQIEEGAATQTPLLQSASSKDNEEN